MMSRRARDLARGCGSRNRRLTAGIRLGCFCCVWNRRDYCVVEDESVQLVPVNTHIRRRDCCCCIREVIRSNGPSLRGDYLAAAQRRQTLSPRQWWEDGALVFIPTIPSLAPLNLKLPRFKL